MAVDLRGRRLPMIAAAAIGALLILYLLVGRPSPPDTALELVSPAERAPAPVAAPQPAAALPPAPAASPEGLRLHGLTATGAIIAFPSGTQRLVRVGQDVLPGLVLKEVRQHSALLESGSNQYQLDFSGVAAAPGAAAQASASSPSEAAIREETLRYRLGLEPRRAEGRIVGFAIRPGASLPALERAGLRSGDVIVGVNGSAFDEERMLELSWQIANSDRTEFDVERAGRRLRLATPARTP